MAREGIVIERKARPVHIFSITILEMDLPWVKMRVECSKGTYIRTLCEDIGEHLSCGGCMESLLRTRVSEFKVEDALTLSEIESRVKSQSAEIAPQEWDTSDFDFIRSVDSVFLQYEKAVVKKEWNKLLYNGNRLPETAWKEEPEATGSERIRVYDEEGHFIGLYEYQQEKQEYKPVKLFIET